jgi:hypothetical protein
MNLDDAQIASPCKADWNKMTGDERVRFCHDCKLNVYDISQMTRSEAEELLTPKGGKLPCVQLWRRRDGTIITKECPIGWRDRVEQLCVRAGAVASFIFAFLINSAGAQELQGVKGKVAAEKPVNTATPVERGQIMPTKGEPVMVQGVLGRIKIQPTEAVELNVSSSIVSRRGTWQEKHKEGTRLAMEGIKPNKIDAGKVEQARRSLITQGERAAELNFNQEAAISFNNAGNCAFYLGKTDDAVRLYERALAVSTSSCGIEGANPRTVKVRSNILTNNSRNASDPANSQYKIGSLSQNTESIVANMLIAEGRGAKKVDVKKLDPRVAVLYEQLKAAQHARLVWIHTINGGLSYTIANLPKRNHKQP